MPTYLYGCSVCGQQKEATRTVANRRRAPRHCGRGMKIQITARYHIQPAFTPYRAIGGDRRAIHTRAEHRDFLKEFNYEEVGNDASMAPPPVSDEEFMYERNKQRAEIEHSFMETEKLTRDLADLAKSPGES